MKKIIFILIAIVLVVVVILSNNKKSIQTQPSGENVPTVSPTQTENKYKTQTNSEGEVTVEVTPISLSKESNVQFKVVLNTHSVALDKDLKDISVLTDDKGSQYDPISWSGGTGGHHLEGELTFPPLKEDVKSIKLTISEIADINRVFEWNIR